MKILPTKILNQNKVRTPKKPKKKRKKVNRSKIILMMKLIKELRMMCLSYPRSQTIQYSLPNQKHK